MDLVTRVLISASRSLRTISGPFVTQAGTQVKYFLRLTPGTLWYNVPGMPELDAMIKVRVPRAMKEAYTRLGRDRLGSESGPAREALLDYLRRRGLWPPAARAAELNESAPNWPVSDTYAGKDSPRVETAAREFARLAVADARKSPPELGRSSQPASRAHRRPSPRKT